MSTISRLCVCLTLFSIAAFAQQTLAPPPFSSLTLPEGFQIALYTGNALPSARQMTISESPEGAPDGNIVYVGSSGGNVSLLVIDQSLSSVHRGRSTVTAAGLLFCLALVIRRQTGIPFTVARPEVLPCRCTPWWIVTALKEISPL